MTVDFPDGVPRPLHDCWRDKFDDAYAHYSENPTPENRAEVMRILRIFADLMLRDKLPTNSE